MKIGIDIVKFVKKNDHFLTVVKNYKKENELSYVEFTIP